MRCAPLYLSCAAGRIAWFPGTDVLRGETKGVLPGETDSGFGGRVVLRGKTRWGAGGLLSGRRGVMTARCPITWLD
ncbi:MAG: hypothetical protein ACRYGC_12900 [Janthinobacterium lividum]